jgi:hypothetical protein
MNTARERIAQQVGLLVISTIEQQAYIEEIERKLEVLQKTISVPDLHGMRKNYDDLDAPKSAAP